MTNKPDTLPEGRGDLGAGASSGDDRALVNEAATHLHPTGFDPSREVTLALRPISTDEWSKLSSREQQLSAISDALAYWINWTISECRAEKFTVTPDTHIILSGDNAPPHWPSVGQLSRWIMVLRDSDGRGEASETGTGSTEGDSAGPKDIAQPQPQSLLNQEKPK